MDIAALERHRKQRDGFFGEHYASPLPEEDMERFAGLRYFAPDPRWRLVGSWTPEPEDARLDVVASTGTASAYRLAGWVDVDLGGESYHLAVLDDGDGGRFVPFRDVTCGQSTYPGGRYVPVEVDGRTAVVDFNYASNPYCAYDEEFSCPLPPPGYVLPVRIEAGEKDYRPPDR